MAKELILVVDDEEDVLELVSYNLQKENYRIETALTGEEAIAKAVSLRPNLILLDLMLPGIDGLEVCRKLKNDEKTSDIPIIMATAKSEEADIVTGLELGADDYITKPFSPKVLIARIRRSLSRQKTKSITTDILNVHNIEINAQKHEVLAGSKKIDLTYTEFGILCVMAKRPGVVFTRYQLVDEVHGNDHMVTDRSVDVQIVSLRKKLGKSGKYIETVRGVGYRMKDTIDNG